MLQRHSQAELSWFTKAVPGLKTDWDQGWKSTEPPWALISQNWCQQKMSHLAMPLEEVTCQSWLEWRCRFGKVTCALVSYWTSKQAVKRIYGNEYTSGQTHRSYCHSCSSEMYPSSWSNSPWRVRYPSSLYLRPFYSLPFGGSSLTSQISRLLIQ